MKKAAKPVSASLITHGLAVSILEKGVLILGESGSGKTETALSLLDRGHQLISDDAVLLKNKNSQLIASSPDDLYQSLQLTSIGIIDPKIHFTQQSIRSSTCIELAIKLTNKITTTQNIDLDFTHIHFLGIKLPLFTVDNRSSHSLALRLETLVKQFRLIKVTDHNS